MHPVHATLWLQSGYAIWYAGPILKVWAEWALIQALVLSAYILVQDVPETVPRKP